MAPDAAAALAGLRILDLSWGIAGPSGVLLLAEQGADVVKVEPIGGDPLRHQPGSAVWLRSRRSIALDLATTDGREVLLDLCAQADVLVETFAPGTTSRLGIAYADLAERFERLVYCSCPAYPPGHRFAARPGWDALVSARLGLPYEQPGWRAGPTFLHFPAPSMAAAFLVASGILAALIEREATGLGQHVETSLYQGGFACTTQIWVDAERASPMDHLMMGKSYPPGVHQFSLYECAAGEWVHAATVSGRTPTRTQDEILGLEPLDPVVAFGMSTAERGAREQLVRDAFRRRDRAELIEEFHAAGLGAEAVVAPPEALHHPQIVANDMVVTVDDPALGAVRQVGVPIHLTATPGAVRGPRPRPGEHTRAILGDLGYSPATVDELVRRGVVAVGDPAS